MIAVVLLVGSIGLFACSRESTGNTPKAAARNTSAQKTNFATPWQDETEFIVISICTDLAEMVAFESAGKPVAAEGPSATVTLTGRPHAATDDVVYDGEIALPGMPAIPLVIPTGTGVWNPKTYVPIVTELRSRCESESHARPDDRQSSSKLLEDLLTPTPSTLCSADERISAELLGAPGSPENHEGAALLLGAFALRDASGKFFEIRHELNRMTAHLAMAEALRGDHAPSLEGTVASAVLEALCNNQVQALRTIASLPTDDPVAAAWSRALRTRVTEDFRISQSTKTPTLLEFREQLRATMLSLSPDQAANRLQSYSTAEDCADWTRILGLRQGSVSLGHMLHRDGLTAEIAECRNVYRACFGKGMSSNELIAALNTPPSGCISIGPRREAAPRVIGWGTWAASFQRHVCQAIVRDFDFMQNRWGVPDEARDYRSRADRQFAGLDLYPLVRRQEATDSDYYRRAQEDTMGLIRSRPHLVPAAAWNDVCAPIPGVPLYIPPPHAYVNEWHRQNPPAGTAYDLAPRFYHPSLTKRPDAAARIQALLTMAPYDEIAIHYASGAGKADADPTKVAAAYGPLLEYKPYLMLHLARLWGSRPEAEDLLKRASHLEPAASRMLAELYVYQGRESDAARYYEAWIQAGPDSVSKSVDVGWLIKYYERHGRSAEATELADEAARVYSSGGLQAKAALLEMRQDYRGAHEYYVRVDKRYRDPGPLFGFLFRFKQATGRDDFHAEYLTLQRKLVPGGLNRFAPPSTDAPKRGVLVQTDNRTEIRSVGLVKGDVIVSARGYEVADWISFKMIRELAPDEVIPVTIWRSSRYLDLPPLPPGHRFGVDLIDYAQAQ